MNWLRGPDTDVPGCVHVACVDWRGEQGPCQYAPQPPAIGPELPEVIRDAEGGYWMREHEGKCFFARTDGGYEVAVWSVVRRRLDGADPEPPYPSGYRFDRIPAGRVVVTCPEPAPAPA